MSVGGGGGGGGGVICETPTLRDHLMGTLQVEAHS